MSRIDRIEAEQEKGRKAAAALGGVVAGLCYGFLIGQYFQQHEERRLARQASISSSLYELRRQGEELTIAATLLAEKAGGDADSLRREVAERREQLIEEAIRGKA